MFCCRVEMTDYRISELYDRSKKLVNLINEEKTDKNNKNNINNNMKISNINVIALAKERRV